LQKAMFLILPMRSMVILMTRAIIYLMASNLSGPPLSRQFATPKIKNVRGS
jgi:hypothetical protein